MAPAVSFAASIWPAGPFEVYDGDTFYVDMPHWPEPVRKRLGIRVRGIDTPEIKGKCDSEKDLALQARDHVRIILSKGRVELRNTTRGKYFRLVSDVYVDGIDLGKSLINQGLAREYHGGKRQSWCPE